MAEPKTKKTEASVEKFLAKLDPAKREDCRTLVAMMRKASGAEPKMWGSSIVGFGQHHYVYASGREGDWPVAGFSPRKNELSIYLSCDIQNQFPTELSKLGKHKTGKGCLYVKRLADVDLKVLEAMIRRGVKEAPLARL